MNIFSKSGDKIYSIASPNSIYNNNEQRFELKTPTINIFNGEETKYIINSDYSTLSDNNKLLKLKGNVKLKLLSKMRIFYMQITLVGILKRIAIFQKEI